MKIGQHVVCIKDFTFETVNNRRSLAFILKYGCGVPVKGQVYTVRDVIPSTTTEFIGLLLDEIKNPLLKWQTMEAEPRFNREHFRPLQKLKVEDFIEVKAPKELAKA